MKLSILLGLLLGSLSLFSQGPSYEIGDEIKSKSRLIDHKVYDMGNAEFLSVLRNGISIISDEYTLSYAMIDGKGKLLKQGPDLEEKKGVEYVDIFKLGGKIYLLQQVFEKSAKKYNFFLLELDRSSLLPVGKKVLVGEHLEVDGEASIGAYVAALTDPLGKHLLLVTNGSSFVDRFRPVDVEFLVLDSELNVITEALYSPNVLGRYGFPLFKEDGSVYFLRGQTFFQTGPYSTTNFGSPAMIYLPAGGEMETARLKRDFEIGITSDLVYDDDGFCHLAGTAVERRVANGMFYLKFDLDNMETTISKVTPYSRDFLLSVANERDKRKILRSKKDKISLDGFAIVDIVHSSSGDNYLIGEQRRSPLNNELLWFEDLIVMRINQEGLVDWIHTLPKKQKVKIGTRDHRITGAKSLAIGADVYVFYNTDEKNISNPDLEQTASSAGLSNSTIAVAKIQSSGVVSIDYLHVAKSLGFNLVYASKSTDQVGKHLFVILNALKDRRYGKISFE